MLYHKIDISTGHMRVFMSKSAPVTKKAVCVKVCGDAMLC